MQYQRCNANIKNTLKNVLVSISYNVNQCMVADAVDKVAESVALCVSAVDLIPIIAIADSFYIDYQIALQCPYHLPISMHQTLVCGTIDCFANFWYNFASQFSHLSLRVHNAFNAVLWTVLQFQH